MKTTDNDKNNLLQKNQNILVKIEDILKNYDTNKYSNYFNILHDNLRNIASNELPQAAFITLINSKREQEAIVYYNLFKEFIDLNDFNKSNSNKVPIIVLCLRNNLLELADYLLDQGVNLNIFYNNDTILIEYFIHDRTAEILDKYLEKYKISHNIDLDADNTDDDALIHLVAKDSIKTLKVIVKHGADINCSDCYGFLPIELMCIYNNIQGLELLFNHPKIIKGERLLKLAIEYNSYESLKFLLDHNAQLDYEDYKKLNNRFLTDEIIATQEIKNFLTRI